MKSGDGSSKGISGTLWLWARGAARQRARARARLFTTASWAGMRRCYFSTLLF